MGNVTSLRRNGLLDDGSYGLIDDLTLSYDGNQLTSVSDNGEGPTYNNAWNFMDGADSGIEYEYDENGNVTKDLNRNILSIQYNSLNLPSKIEFADGKTIKYTYSADGHKLRAVYTTSMPATSKQIDYCGNLIFENGQLQQINVEGGYVTYVGSFPAYHHYIKDHLGNNRMVIHPSALYLQPQVNNYYPYGGLMANSTQHNQQRYKYNGKEFDRMHGLDWYDYGARWMDASIGRWHSVDPLCEKYPDVSPYLYCLNNPIKLVDPDGKQIMTPIPMFGVTDILTFGKADIIMADGGKIVEVQGRGAPSSQQIHHWIPRQLKNHPTVKKAIKGGYKFEGKENKSPLNTFSKSTGKGQHANHPRYNQQIKNKLDNVDKGLSSKQAAKAVRQIRNAAKKTVEKNPDQKVNDVKIK